MWDFIDFRNLLYFFEWRFATWVGDNIFFILWDRAINFKDGRVMWNSVHYCHRCEISHFVIPNKKGDCTDSRVVGALYASTASTIFTSHPLWIDGNAVS